MQAFIISICGDPNCVGVKFPHVSEGFYTRFTQTKNYLVYTYVINTDVNYTQSIKSLIFLVTWGVKIIPPPNPPHRLTSLNCSTLSLHLSVQHAWPLPLPQIATMTYPHYTLPQYKLYTLCVCSSCMLTSLGEILAYSLMSTQSQAHFSHACT